MWAKIENACEGVGCRERQRIRGRERRQSKVEGACEGVRCM